MATTDIHMHLFPFDYSTDAPNESIGLAKTATLIQRARGETPNALLFDNGDFLHGSLLGEEEARRLITGHMSAGRFHPAISAMRLLKYDAITLGNHDFDKGVDFLGEVMERANFPVVVSNLTLKAEDGVQVPPPLPFSTPFALLDREIVDDAGQRDTIRVGVLGFLPPGRLPGVFHGPFQASIRDIVETARQMVPALHGLGAEVVVVLAHSGIGAAQHQHGMENAVVPLAEVPGIDAIIAGHSHQLFPGDTALASRHVDPVSGRIHGVPVVSPGFWGSHLGLIDLGLTKRDGKWTVSGAQVSVRSVKPAKAPAQAKITAPEQRALRALRRRHDEIRAGANRPVGVAGRRVHSYFSKVMPSAALDLVHRAMIWRTRRDLCETPLAGLPVLASTAPFKAGGIAGPGFYTDIPAGLIPARSLFDLYPFPNTLCALEITGQDLTEWLERAASNYLQITPGGGEQAMISGDVPAYVFESVAGCSYSIDLSGPPRYRPDGVLNNAAFCRIRDVRIDSKPLRPDAKLVLVTNDFRIVGKQMYPLPQTSCIIGRETVAIRDVIAEYLEETGPYNGKPLADWRFLPVRGAALCFPSSPRAVEVVSEVPGLEPCNFDRTPEGFRYYRLTV